MSEYKSNLLSTNQQEVDLDVYGTFHHTQSAPSTRSAKTARWTRNAPMRVAVVVAVTIVISFLLAKNSTPLGHETISVKDTLAESTLADAQVHSIRVYRELNGMIDAVMDDRHNDREADAWATFNDSLHTIGWSQLWVQTASLPEANAGVKRKRQTEILFAAGYAEGMLTHHRIDEHYKNVFMTFFPNGDLADKQTILKLKVFLQQNIDWMREHIEFYAQSEQQDHPDAAYWDAMSGLLAQFDGLVAGYQRASQEPSGPISSVEMFMLNADGDLEDLISIVQMGDQEIKVSPVTQALEMFLKNLKCSALIRILPDFQEIVWGHATWDVYSSMNRIFKHYDLPLPASVASSELDTTNGRRKISLSSSPGYLSSVDDWYMTDAGLGVMETTHGVFDPSLYKTVTSKSVLCWLRSKVANMLATSGATWADTFAKYNSGTYNDQWMIIDTKRFVKGQGLQSQGLTVLEQLPGFIHVEDMSEVINRQGYWASYNVPYFSSTYERSGFMATYLATNESDSWSHARCPRAQIFARDAPKIESMTDFKQVIRSNNWQQDPLSLGHPSHAVAARYDLEDEPMFALDGAIDAKVTTSAMLKQMTCEAESGPTYADGNSVFEWTTALDALSPHFGHPQRFEFGYHTMVHLQDF